MCYITNDQKNCSAQTGKVFPMKTDIEIASEAKPKRITQIAAELGLTEDQIDQYGKYKAKICEMPSGKMGKLILVTAMTPTKQGDGKTTISIGLADALRQTGRKSVLALREPSLGPVFGMKGGAAGGGYSQVIPMEDINLHFTGDFHAITSANNLLCAMVDNHIQQGNALNIDPRTITLKRCVDMNDRMLRNVIIGLGGRANGIPREDHFCITVASEVMAVFCLSNTLEELKENLKKIIVGKTFDGREIFAEEINAAGAMTALLRDAFRPNLVQTLEGTPAVIHGGPFANIAHGCNSVAATKAALRLGDYVVTEAGFGADLGAEKFIDIKCRKSGLKPACAVMVATIKAMKMHGQGDMKTGFENVKKHYCNLTEKFGLNVIVALNKFGFDTDEEIALFRSLCDENGMPNAIANGYCDGGKGCIELAEKVAELAEKESDVRFLYDLEDSVEEKIASLCKGYYGAAEIKYSSVAEKKIRELGEAYRKYPICMAKTQYSFSDDGNILNAPSGFPVTVRDIEVRNGCGFIIVYLGDIMTMPGLPKVPSANNIDVTPAGQITGIF